MLTGAVDLARDRGIPQLLVMALGARSRLREPSDPAGALADAAEAYAIVEKMGFHEAGVRAPAVLAFGAARAHSAPEPTARRGAASVVDGAALAGREMLERGATEFAGPGDGYWAARMRLALAAAPGVAPESAIANAEDAARLAREQDAPDVEIEACELRARLRPRGTQDPGADRALARGRDLLPGRIANVPEPYRAGYRARFSVFAS
jgi:hypothetical protein